MDSVRFIVEECNNGEEFGEGCSYRVLEFLTGDALNWFVRSKKTAAGVGRELEH